MSKALFLVSLFSLTLHAGVVIKLKHFEGERPGPADRPKVEEMVHYVQGTKAKMETYGPNHELMHGTIFDADAQTFTNFNVKTKTYTKLDKTKFQAMANHMRDYLAEMKKSPQHKAMLAKLPPDQRKKFEEQMKAMEKMQNATTKALTEEPKKIAENVKVGKYTCTKYEEQVAASRIENCNVPFDQVGIGPDEIKFFEKMAKMMEGLLGPAQMGPYTKSFLSARLKIGFPVATWIYHKDMQNDKEFMSDRTELASVDKRTIPDSEFVLPAGYKEQVLMRPMMGEKQRINVKGGGASGNTGGK